MSEVTHSPQSPLPAEAGYGPIEIAVSLGSNVGDRLAHLSRARQAITGLEGVTLTAQSRVYETEPVDVQPQFADRPFLNAVLVLSSRVSPEAFAHAIHRIEDDAGRVRGTDRNAPRPLDIDLIYADGLTVHTESLRLPHPRWAQRRFVAQPLADVCPDRVLPGQTLTVAELLLTLPPTPKVFVFAEQW